MASQPIIKMRIVVKSLFTPKLFSYTACFFKTEPMVFCLI